MSGSDSTEEDEESIYELFSNNSSGTPFSRFFKCLSKLGYEDS